MIAVLRRVQTGVPVMGSAGKGSATVAANGVDQIVPHQLAQRTAAEMGCATMAFASVWMGMAEKIVLSGLAPTIAHSMASVKRELAFVMKDTRAETARRLNV